MQKLSASFIKCIRLRMNAIFIVGFMLFSYCGTYAQNNPSIEVVGNSIKVTTVSNTILKFEKEILVDFRKLYLNTHINTTLREELIRVRDARKSHVIGNFSHGSVVVKMDFTGLNSETPLFYGSLGRVNTSGNPHSLTGYNYSLPSVKDGGKPITVLSTNFYKVVGNSSRIHFKIDACRDCRVYEDQNQKLLLSCDQEFLNHNNVNQKRLNYREVLNNPNYPKKIVDSNNNVLKVLNYAPKDLGVSDILNFIFSFMGKCLNCDDDNSIKIEADQSAEECIKTSAYPIQKLKVTVEIEGTDVQLDEVYVPIYGKIYGKEFNLTGESLQLTLYGPDKQVKQKVSVNSDKLYSKNIKAKMGDRVEFTYTSGNNIKPVIKGLPAVHISGFAAERKFMTDPDFGPNQYLPFIPWESHTHEKILNVYPTQENKGDRWDRYNNFKPKSDPWSEETIISQNGYQLKKYRWTHTLQRRTTPNIVAYSSQYEFPKIKFYKGDPNKPQREGQTIGWFAEFMQYWKVGHSSITNEDNLNYLIYDESLAGAPRYVLGSDVDEIFYMGSLVKNQKTADPQDKAKLYRIKTYTKNGQANWQHMWEDETEIISDDGQNRYVFPKKYDSRLGFPKKGFVYNDYLNLYLDYKRSFYNHPDLSPSPGEEVDFLQYFRTYEIEDYGTYYKTDDYYQPTSTTELKSTLVNGKNIPAKVEKNVWWVPSQSKGNNKHPSLIYFFEENSFDQIFNQNHDLQTDKAKYTVSIEVDAPLSEDYGFYGSLKGSQWPSTKENGSNPKFTLHGLKNLSDEELKRFEFEYQVYFKGDGIVHTEGRTPLKLNSEHFDRAAGTFKTHFEDYGPDSDFESNTINGWAVVTANYVNDYGDRVIIAGRDINTNGDPASISAPGSVPDEFGEPGVRFVPPINGVDLREGRGERTNERIKDVKNNQNFGDGDVFPITNFNPHNGLKYKQYTDFYRKYVIDKSTSLMITTMDNGRTWSPNVDNYLTWREHTRKPPNDTVISNIQYMVAKLDGPYKSSDGEMGQFRIYSNENDDNFANPYKGSRALIINPNPLVTPYDNGDYVVKVKYAENDQIAHARVRITDYSEYDKAIDANFLSKKYRRGIIHKRELRTFEYNFLKNMLNLDEQLLDSYIVFEVKDIYSLYKYDIGPRATTYNHRFGNFNDFDNSFEWTYKGFNIPNDDRLNQALNLGQGNALGKYFWTDGFGKNFVRHLSSNHFPEDEIDKTELLIDFDAPEYNAPLDNFFADSNINQYKSAQRWLPWVAFSPRSNSKLNRWVKTITDLDLFFNSEKLGYGAWSGLNAYPVKFSQTQPFNPLEEKPYYTLREVTLGPEWFFWNEGSQTNEIKEAKEFYGDIQSGRIKVVRKTAFGSTEAGPLDDDNIKVFNNNATKGKLIKDWAGRKNIQNNLPEKIFIAQGLHDKNVPFQGVSMNNLLEDLDELAMVNEIPIPHFAGIPLITSNQAQKNKTEFNSDYKFYKRSISNTVEVPEKLSIRQENNNPYLKLDLSYNSGTTTYYDLMVSTYKILPPDVIPDNQEHLYHFPNDVAFKTFKGVRFRAKLLKGDNVSIRVSGKNINGEHVFQKTFTLTNQWQDFHAFKAEIVNSYSNSVRKLEFTFISNGSNQSAEVALDDVFIDNGNVNKWIPSVDDDQMITWLKNTVFRFLIWNTYEKPTDSNQLFLNESTNEFDKVTISGQGMAIVGYILSERLLESNDANKLYIKNTVKKLLKWIDNIELGDHNFPYHFYDANGRSKYTKAQGGLISTIDWAICALGVRAAKQHYINDSEIVTLTDRILARPDWSAMINGNGRIAHEVDINGNLNNEWGLAFSEETDMVYAEAIASGKLSEVQENTLISTYERKIKFGFIPSHFGAGFTYNWLQLWTGKQNSLEKNSKNAFCYDLESNNSIFTFNLPVIGLTAGTIISKSFDDGFLEWNKYVSNQGPIFEHGTQFQGEVIQQAIMPYGTGLAYPFLKDEAIKSFREIFKLGNFHPLLGIPESISIKQNEHQRRLGSKYFSCWNQFDINMLSMFMALHMNDDNYLISELLFKDLSFKMAAEKVLDSYSLLTPQIQNARCGLVTDTTSSDEYATNKTATSPLEQNEDTNAIDTTVKQKILKLVPNPVHDHLIIKDLSGSIEEEIEYKIIDRSFKIVKQGYLKKFNNGETSIELNGLPTSSYYISFTGKGFYESHFILKK